MGGITKEEYIRRHGIDAWEKRKEGFKTSEEKYIKKYGDEEGRKRWKESKSSHGITLENQIKKYGETEGTKRYNDWLNKRKDQGTLPYYVEKYGEVLGKEKYLEKNSRLSVGETTLKNNGYSDEEIANIKSKHSSRSAITLENQIKKYGETEGTKRYNDWLTKSTQRSHWHVDFWTNRGYSIEDAKTFISLIQATSSLDRFIERYGDEDGTKRYLDVNKKKTEKWVKSTGNISKLEKMWMNELSKITELDLEKGCTCRLVVDKRTYYCDYVQDRKIIEIYGTFWHMKPGIYNKDYINPVSKLTAEEKWHADQYKIENLKKSGYEVMIIWEDEISDNLDETLQRAKVFLES